MKQHYHGPKQIAWEAVRCFYVRRITGGAFVNPRLPDTEFPAEEVANGVPLPESTHVSQHEMMFARLKHAFEEAWA